MARGTDAPIHPECLLLGALASGLGTLPGALARAVTSVTFGRLYDRNGVRGIVVAGSILLVLGYLGMLSLDVGTSLVYMAVCYVLIGVGVQSLMTTVNAWGISKLNNDEFQHATALTNTVTQIGGSLGTAFVVSVAAYGITRFSLNDASMDGIQLLAASYHLSFIVLFGISIIIAVLIFLFVRNKATVDKSN